MTGPDFIEWLKAHPVEAEAFARSMPHECPECGRHVTDIHRPTKGWQCFGKLPSGGYAYVGSLSGNVDAALAIAGVGGFVEAHPSEHAADGYEYGFPKSFQRFNGPRPPANTTG